MLTHKQLTRMGLIFILFCIYGCDQYLTIESDNPLNEKDIFTSYETFQGFLDPLYTMMVDYNCHAICVTANIGGEAVNAKPWGSGHHGATTDYHALVYDGSRSIFRGYGIGTQNHQNGIWDFWSMGCRIANLGLEHLPMLTDASDEEKNKLKGQALFFRAFLHWEVARAWGTIPYLDQVYSSVDINLPRHWEDEQTGKHDYQAVSERMVRDLEEAAELLPEQWEEQQLGRITKGACYALLSKVLLFAGSPLMNEASGEENKFDKTYMQRSAEAAARVIQLMDKGIYELTPWEDYKRLFATIEGVFPGTKETILMRYEDRGWGMGPLNNVYSRSYFSSPFTGSAVVDLPTQKFIDKFEMKNGGQYQPGGKDANGFDNDMDKFFHQRDNRFDFNHWIHKETYGSVTLGFADGQLQFNDSYYSHLNMISPFYITKYYYPLVDSKNRQCGLYTLATPIIRLADVLLLYSEAVFEASGNPIASLDFDLTALQALNMVRTRAGQPLATAEPDAYKIARSRHGELPNDHPFRLLVRNERAVELCYEGHYWWDIRRWKRGHLVENKLWRLYFNEDFTEVKREVINVYDFQQRHYWLPFPKSFELLEDFDKNPGW